jgi:hypothetical protein
MSQPPLTALEDRDVRDGRLFSPSAGRNKEVVSRALADLLPHDARVLEIASGTGEQGIATCLKRPDLHWQFSDPDPTSRESQAAWIAHEQLDLPAPLNINTSQNEWTVGLPHLDAIFCANMIHIAPLSATEGLADGAKERLDGEGLLILYGPYLFGEDSAPSNLDFDLSLKSRNPAWGVRSLDLVKHIFALRGFNLAELRAMPKNNHILVFSQGGTN